MEHRALPRPLKVAALMLLCATVATPCSFDTTPILFFEVRPDMPIDDYVDGRLGIVQPAYARSHLVVAYRYLSGKPLSDAEREGAGSLLRHRLQEEGRPADPVEQWERLRSNLRGVEYKWPPSRTRSVAGAYDSYDNCTDDAFATASKTLAQHMKTYGAASPAVMHWLNAQEMVFANCAEGEARIPAWDESLPAALRADRQYQIAAANFYALRYDDARARFLAIARDRQSPWQKTARLVAARILIRAENLDVAIQAADPLALADQELRAILADASMKPLHDAAWDLLAVTTLRRDPERRFHEAAQALLGGETSARRMRTHLADYTILWDKEVTGNDELTDWIKTFQSGDAAHALERWNATKGTQWLVAALTHVKPDDASVAALLEASKAIGTDSAAATSIAYHRVRLLLAAERDDDARAELDRVLARDLPVSARNQLLAQRRAVARTLAEFLRDTPSRPVGEGTDAIEPGSAPPRLPDDAAVVLNYWTPLETLTLAAADETLPAEIREPLARAVSTRKMLLDNPSFATADLLVHDEEAKPYVDAVETYGNWWCAGGGSPQTVPVPVFLRPTLYLASAEHEELRMMGSGATWILRTVIAHAMSHPNDPRVPEALSLAILGTRRACGDADTEKLAKEAFGVLHRKYGKTSWAAETPYWYKPY